MSQHLHVLSARQMVFLSESQKGRGDDRNGQDFLTLERVTTIGTWNMRTLNTVTETGLLMHELSHFRCNVIGSEEMHWTRTKDLVVNGCKMINSGKHATSLASMLSSLAQKCILVYRSVND